MRTREGQAGAFPRGERAVRRGINRKPQVQRGKGPGTPDGLGAADLHALRGQRGPTGEQQDTGLKQSVRSGPARGPTLWTT